jgi:branched-chain amino acid transport system permease protein
VTSRQQGDLLPGRKAAPLAVLLLLCVLPLLGLLPLGDQMNVDYWVLRLGEIFALAIYALSFNILFGYTGIISVGHALFYGGGAYLFGIALRSAGFDPVGALLAALLGMAVLGLAVGFLCARLRGFYLAMVTLALAEIALIVVLAPELQPFTGAEDGLRPIPMPAWLTVANHRAELYYLALGVLVLVLLGLRWLMETPAGRVLVAIRENERRAENLGYNVRLFKTAAFVLAAAVAALAGALSVVLRASATPPTLSIEYSTLPIVAAVIGGAGTVLGPVVGVIAVALAQDFLRERFEALWILMYSALALLIVLQTPRGLLGRKRGRSGPGSVEPAGAVPPPAPRPEVRGQALGSADVGSAPPSGVAGVSGPNGRRSMDRMPERRTVVGKAPDNR